MEQPGRSDAARVGALAAIVALSIWLPRLAPTVTLLGDSAVFVSAAATFGVPQPSGYPLWTLVGWMFSKVPLGDVAYRVHLSSAIFHAATVFVVGWLVTTLSPSRVVGLVSGLSAALCLAFSRAFFLGSLYAEVFPLNDLFTALALAASIELWRRRDAPQAEVDQALNALAWISGLASAHHQTIALLAPALALLVFGSGAWLRIFARFPALLVRFVTPIAVFLLLLLVVAARDPFVSWGDVRSLSALFRLVTRADYGGPLSPHLGGKELEASVLAHAWLEGQALAYGWLLLGVACVGAVAAFVRDRSRDWPVAIALVTAVLMSGPVFAAMNQLEVDTEHGRAFAERFSTMSAVPIAILVGLGIAAALRAGERWFPPPMARVVLGLSFVLPLSRHASDCDLRDDRRGLQVAHDLVNDVPDGSLVLITGDALNGAALWVCGVERRCGNTLVFTPGQMHLDWRVAQLRRRHPDLALPVPAGKFISVRELVGANLPRRPIFLSPQILDLEPPLRDAFQFLPEHIHVRALRTEDLDAFKASFPERARRFARADACEGCGIARADLRAPSLETSLPFLYALAFENHARVLGAWFEEPALAAFFSARAEQIDPEGIRRVRAPGP
ncbi:MAG: DUF2723 domain-containing protein [Deltaproteobacteria bacterium]|nr:DUF2723 domain-containing protein [Deltaproteobacteria bacterium]